MQPVIATTGLCKRYGDVAALTDLDLAVRPGEIYGLVGRNGAGKTTLMRLLLGLLTPTAGTVTVFGRPAGDPGALARVGALVESPALYPHLSGRDNLRLLGLYSGVGPAGVDDALARVGLGERAGSRFSTYSLGMKQRLGVAAALLGDPDLLILDEPSNGLDPGAMAEFRDLLRGVRDEGRTVLLSSHLLGEVEQVCDRIGVVHDGRLVVEGTIEEIHASASGGGRTIAVRAEPADAAIAVLRAAVGVRSATTDGALVTAVLDGLSIGGANRALVEAGVEVSELRPVRRSLEDVFLGLTAVDAESYLAGVGAANDDRIGALA